MHSGEAKAKSIDHKIEWIHNIFIAQSVVQFINENYMK